MNKCGDEKGKRTNHFLRQKEQALGCGGACWLSGQNEEIGLGDRSHDIGHRTTPR
jgi:hypothetical protein